MYGIFTYMYHKKQPNVGKYTIHESYGNGHEHGFSPCGLLTAYSLGGSLSNEAGCGFLLVTRMRSDICRFFGIPKASLHFETSQHPDDG